MLAYSRCVPVILKIVKWFFVAASPWLILLGIGVVGAGNVTGNATQEYIGYAIVAAAVVIGIASLLVFDKELGGARVEPEQRATRCSFLLAAVVHISMGADYLMAGSGIRRNKASTSALCGACAAITCGIGEGCCLPGAGHSSKIGFWRRALRWAE